MTAAPSRSGLLRPGHPVQLPRVLVRHLPGRRPRRPTPTTSTSSPTRTACTPSCAWSPIARRRRRPTPRGRHPAPARPGAAARGRIEPPTRRRTPCGCAATGLGPAHRGRRTDADPVQRHLLLPATRSTARTSSPRTRPAAATGSPCCPARVADVTGRRGARPAERGVADRRRRRGPGRSRSRSTTRARRPTAGRHLRRGRRRRPRRDVRRLRRRRRALARRRAPRPPSSPPTCCGRRRSRPAGFVTRPAVLMSKHWMDKVWSWDHCFNALALAAGTPGAGLGPVPAALRPPGRDRCAARLGHPLRGALQLRQAAHPRLGAAAGCADGCPRRRPRSWPRRTTGWRAGPGSGSPPPGPRPRTAPLPARQRQRLGQRHHLRPRPGHRDRRPRRVPRPPTRELADLADELGLHRDATGWTAAADRMPRRPAATSCGTATGSSPRGAARRATWASTSLLDLHADRARRATCPATVRRRAGRPASRRT